MRPRVLTIFVASAALIASGCASLRKHEVACKVASGVIGGALGATGGGLGVSEIENGPSNGERAAGAGAGLVVGAVVGNVIGHFVCKADQPPPPPPPAPPPPKTKIAELKAAHFDFDKAVLKPEGKRKLDEVVALMKQHQTLRVSSEGHTDSIGSDAYNMKLGERRAQAAKDYLVSQGIASNRITVRSFGEAKPVASNQIEDGRAQNRRVEIITE